MTKNNDKKTVYGTRLDKQDGKTIILNKYLIREHGADAGNIRHAGNELTLLGDKISLSVDKACSIARFVNTSLSDRFKKVSDTWYNGMKL